MALDPEIRQSLQSIADAVKAQTVVLSEKMDVANEEKETGFKKEATSLQEYIKDFTKERKAAMVQVKTYLRNADSLNDTVKQLADVTSETEGFQQIVADVRKQYEQLDVEQLDAASKKQITTLLDAAEQYKTTTADVRRLSESIDPSKLEDLSDATQTHVTALLAAAKQQKTTTAELKKLHSAINVDELDEATQGKIETLMDAAKAQKTTTEDLRRLSRALDTASIKQKESGLTALKGVKQQHGISKVFGEVKSRSTKMAKGFFTVNKGIALMSAAITRFVLTMKDSVRAQAPMMDALAGSWEGWTAKYGLSSTKFMKNVDENSQMFLANAKAGSDLRSAATQFLPVFSNLSDAAYDLTADYDDAGDLVSASISALSAAGVDTSFDNIEDGAKSLMGSLSQLAKVTNKTAAQNADALKMAMKDSVVKKAMLQLGKKERLQFVNKMAQDQLLLISKGFEADAALEAVKALKGIAGQDPKERLKQAALMSAQAASLGVEGGQEMMKLAMKPVETWTKDETKRAQQFGTDMENAVAQGLGSENFGKQAQTFALDTASAGGFKDAIMGLSSAGMEGMAIDEQTMEVAKSSESHLSFIGGILKTMVKGWDRIAAIFSDMGMMLVTGIGVVLLGVVTGFFSPLIVTVLAIAAGIAAVVAAVTWIAGAMPSFGDIGESIGNWWNDNDEKKEKDQTKVDAPMTKALKDLSQDAVDKAQQEKLEREKQKEIEETENKSTMDQVGDYNKRLLDVQEKQLKVAENQALDGKENNHLNKERNNIQSKAANDANRKTRQLAIRTAVPVPA